MIYLTLINERISSRDGCEWSRSPTWFCRAYRALGGISGSEKAKRKGHSPFGGSLLCTCPVRNFSTHLVLGDLLSKRARFNTVIGGEDEIRGVARAFSTGGWMMIVALRNCMTVYTILEFFRCSSSGHRVTSASLPPPPELLKIATTPFRACYSANCFPEESGITAPEKSTVPIDMRSQLKLPTPLEAATSKSAYMHSQYALGVDLIVLTSWHGRSRLTREMRIV